MTADSLPVVEYRLPVVLYTFIYYLWLRPCSLPVVVIVDSLPVVMTVDSLPVVMIVDSLPVVTSAG